MSQLHRVTHAVTDNPLGVTLTGSCGAFVFWGLHVSDIAVLLSAAAAVLGVVLQFYVAMRRLHVIEQDLQMARLVAGAGAEATRVVSGQIKAVEKRLDG